uniref:CCHC-type domain-containing protein n=1 Tax=Nothobranchius korthausae TaxID=1143690 RepID=A0A1A8GUC7_9TELE
MATFDLQSFVEAPSLRLLERAQKAGLQEVAAHFDLVVPKKLSTVELRKFVVDYLEAQGILPPQSETEPRPPSPPVTSDKDMKPEKSSPGSQSPDQSPPTSPLSHTRLKLRLARLQIEADERALDRRLRHELDLKKLDAEMQLKMLEVELRNKQPVPATVWTSPPEHDDPDASHAGVRLDPSTPTSPPLRPTFDVSKCISLLPHFKETEVDGYFNAFERIAGTLQWPGEVWSLLLTCKLTGKALQVVSALSPTDGACYEKVKSAVLTAYELVPEAYRQRFRFERPQVDQSYVEYAHRKAVLFDKWCSASHVSSFEELKELILIEELKRHLPERIVLYLNEQKVTSFSDAALLADEFSLTHRVRETHSETNRVFKSRVRTSPNAGNEKPECFYCHKSGHVIRDCYSLKMKNRRTGNSPNKGRPEIACCVKANANAEKPNPSYQPFISEGFVSLPGSDSNTKIVILRDTGASQTLIKRNVLSFSDSSQAGYSVLLQGIEMGTISAEMHHVTLTCPLVSGDFVVGVLDELPTKGVDVILGNDAAGGLVVPLPELTMQPLVHAAAGPLPACVLTRAQARKDREITLRGSVLHPLMSDGDSVDDDSAVVNPPVFVNFPISYNALVADQKAEKTLQTYFSLTTDDAKSSTGKARVVPARSELTGRLGVNEACDSLLRLVSFVFLILLFTNLQLNLARCELGFATNTLFLGPQTVSRFFFLAGVCCVVADGLDHPVSCFTRKFYILLQRAFFTPTRETLDLIWSFQLVFRFCMQPFHHSLFFRSLSADLPPPLVPCKPPLRKLGAPTSTNSRLESATQEGDRQHDGRYAIPMLHRLRLP